MFLSRHDLKIKLGELLDLIEDLQEKEGNVHNPHIEINPERMPIYPWQK